MVIEIRKFLLLILLLLSLKTADATEKIIVERYENWNHPITAIFKKYGIVLYKVSYSKDGTYPTFYAKFKYSPDPRAPGASEFHKIYFEALKANSYFPYALVDKEEDFRINVGWKDKAKTTFIVEMTTASSPSTCKNGDINSSKFTLTKELKELVLASPFKASLRRNDGKEFIAYLYASDERKKNLDNYPCIDNHKTTIGQYYLYLYDVTAGSFFPERTEIFDGRSDTILERKKANFFVWHGANKSQSDILFISEASTCEGAQYEAYGFFENQLPLKKYLFVEHKKNSSFTGRFDKNKNQVKLKAYALYRGNEIKKVSLSRSINPGEIQIQKNP